MCGNQFHVAIFLKTISCWLVVVSFTLLNCVLKCWNKKIKKELQWPALLIVLVVFDLTWKARFFSAKKDFLKQCCAQEGMLQSRSQRLLFGKKVENIGPLLTNVSHKLEHHLWCHRHLCLRKNACKKKIILFVSQHGIFLSIILSK